MEIKDIILAAIKGNSTLDYIKYISGTSRITVKDYPAVVVENEPSEFEQTEAMIVPVFDNQECTVFYLQKGLPEDEINEDEYNAYMKVMREKVWKISRVIYIALSASNGIANVIVGREDSYQTKIDGENVEVAAITVRAKVKI